MESLQGKLIYFSRINIAIRPLISIFIQLNGRIPLKIGNFSDPKLSFESFLDILPELRLIAQIILPLIKTNPWIEFDWIFPAHINHIGSIIFDASGTGDGYGIGVLIEPNTSFQIERKLYDAFLRDIFSDAPDPDHIMFQELFGYFVAIWFIAFKLKRHHVHVRYVTDNQVSFYILTKSASKTCPNLNKLLFIFGNLAFSRRIAQNFEWVPTHSMAAFLHADGLSRSVKSQPFHFKGNRYQPFQWNRLLFNDFVSFIWYSFSILTSSQVST